MLVNEGGLCTDLSQLVLEHLPVRTAVISCLKTKGNCLSVCLKMLVFDWIFNKIHLFSVL